MDRKAHKKLQEKVSDFQVTCDDNVYLSIGLEAKCDIYNSFDPNETYDIHLEPPSHDHPPLVEIKQKGKQSVYMSYSKTASFLVNCVSGLPSELNGSKCQLTK